MRRHKLGWCCMVEPGVSGNQMATISRPPPLRLNVNLPTLHSPRWRFTCQNYMNRLDTLPISSLVAPFARVYHVAKNNRWCCQGEAHCSPGSWVWIGAPPPPGPSPHQPSLSMLIAPARKQKPVGTDRTHPYRSDSHLRTDALHTVGKPVNHGTTVGETNPQT